MPEVPKRGWPEPGPQPSPEQMQMAAAALAQAMEYPKLAVAAGFEDIGAPRSEPMKEGLTADNLEAHAVKLFSGMRGFVNPERFSEAQQSWPESKNLDYLAYRDLRPLQKARLHESSVKKIDDPIGDLLKRLEDSEIEQMMKKQRDKLRR